MEEPNFLLHTDRISLTGGKSTAEAVSVGDPGLWKPFYKGLIRETGDFFLVTSVADGEIDVVKLGSGVFKPVENGTVQFLATAV